MPVDNIKSFQSVGVAERVLLGSILCLTRGSARVSSTSTFFAVGEVLRADCNTLVFQLIDDDGC